MKELGCGAIVHQADQWQRVVGRPTVDRVHPARELVSRSGTNSSCCAAVLEALVARAQLRRLPAWACVRACQENFRQPPAGRRVSHAHTRSVSVCFVLLSGCCCRLDTVALVLLVQGSVSQRRCECAPARKISDSRLLDGESPGSARQNWVCSILLSMDAKGS